MGKFFKILLLIMKTLKNLKQIGVMASAADLWYTDKISELSAKVGELIACEWLTLVYWAEQGMDSLSTVAARSASENWWTTVGVTYGRNGVIFDSKREYTDVLINTGMDWGWGREFVLVSSCDAVIALWGWSWTLTELAIAYQKKIPIVCIEWTWWRADKLANTYIDNRYTTDPARYICYGAKNPEEAVAYLKWLFVEENECKEDCECEYCYSQNTENK